MTPEERADQVRRALVDCTNVPPGKVTAFLAADLLPPGAVILTAQECAGWNMNDLAVRVARAEIERDAALERARSAEEALAVMCGDTETMLDKLRVLGIPARDVRDIYETVAEHRKLVSSGQVSALPRRHVTEHGGTIIEPSEPRT